MVPFPGSSCSSSSSHPASSHSVPSAVGGYGQQNNHSMHPYSQNSMTANVNSVHQMQQNNEQPFSFTALLQEDNPSFSVEMNQNDQFSASNAQGQFQHASSAQNVQQQNPYQLSSNNAMAPGQGFQQGSAKDKTIDQRALNQLSFSAVNAAGMMSAYHPGMENSSNQRADQQPYHQQGHGWPGHHPHMGHPQQPHNPTVRNTNPTAAQPEQMHGHSFRPGFGMGHTLPQQPAPRTSRVQIRPKAQTPLNTNYAGRPILPKPGSDPAVKQGGDPFSLLKKNIRELEQKESMTKQEMNSGHPFQNGAISASDRSVENVSPADSLSSSTSNSQSGFCGYQSNPEKNVNERSGHLDQVSQAATLSVPQAIPQSMPQSLPQNAGSLFGPIVKKQESTAQAAFSSLSKESDKPQLGTDSQESQDSDDSDASSTATSDTSPRKQAKSSGSEQPTSTTVVKKEENLHPIKEELSSGSPDGLQWKENGSNGSVHGHHNGPGGMLHGMHQQMPMAMRENQMYGPPGNVTVMPGGGFQTIPGREHAIAMRGQAPGIPPVMPAGIPPRYERGSNPKDGVSIKHEDEYARSNSNSPVDMPGRHSSSPPKDVSQAGPKDSTQTTANQPQESKGLPMHNLKPTDSKPLPGEMFDFRSSILEQAKLMQREDGALKQEVGVPRDHSPVPNTFPHPMAAYEMAARSMTNAHMPPHQAYPNVDQQHMLQPVPRQPRESSIPIQSQPPKKRKLYENIEQEMSRTPPSKIWRPGVDPNAMATAGLHMPIPQNYAMARLEPNLPQHVEQKPNLNDIPIKLERSSSPSSTSSRPPSHSNPAAAEPVTKREAQQTATSSSADRASPHFHATSDKPALNLAHLKQETSRPGQTASSKAGSQSQISSAGPHPALSQPSLSTNTHPTFVTVPGLGQPHMIPPGHPGHPAMQHPMAMMGLQAQASPYYHHYLMQQREMHKQLQENGLLYQQQMMQSQMQSYGAYQQQMAAAMAAQQKMMVPENSAQQRLLAHLAQSQANGMMHPQFTGRPPHP